MRIISGEGYNVHFDEAHGLLIGEYGPVVNDEVVTNLYADGFQLAAMYGPEKLLGIIFNFYHVERFARGNLLAVQAETYRTHERLNLEHTPIALIVRTLVQEQVVKLSTLSTPWRGRAQIVYSMDEAITFLRRWKREHTDAADPFDTPTQPSRR
ncbi:MAG: hypothetical protein ACOCXZ_00160 [Chloroflexota bacterium]